MPWWLAMPMIRAWEFSMVAIGTPSITLTAGKDKDPAGCRLRVVARFHNLW